jgi:hypothetical protein
MQIIQKVDNLGRREAVSLATATTRQVFSGLAAGRDRQAVSVFNADAAADIWVRFVARGAAAPTISTTDMDALVPARQSRQFQVGPGVDVYVRHSGAGSVSYTALEMS